MVNKKWLEYVICSKGISMQGMNEDIEDYMKISINISFSKLQGKNEGCVTGLTNTHGFPEPTHQYTSEFV